MKPFYRLVALPLTALSLCATARAEEMYYNRLPLDQVIPAGKYGDSITVPSPGYAATKFSADVAEIPASAGNVGGDYAPIIQKVGSDTDTQTHTVAGWFKLTKKADADTILWAALTYVTSKEQAGYKVAVTKDGKLTVGKTNYPIASYGTQISSTSTVPDGEWFYLTVVVTKASSARTATVKAFVNGKPFEMGADAFGTNVNGNGCISFRMGDGVSCAGLRVDDTAVEDAAAIVSWATNSRYVAEASATATWTGAAQDGDPTNANNWKYVSAAGEEIPGKLPGADTIVFLGGTLQFNATASKTFECRAIIFASDVALSADCDWTGLPMGFATGDYALDLAGHALRLSLLGSGTITGEGALVLDVAEETTLENTAMALAGNLRLVKEGGGIYSCSVQNQTYAGGTVISNGTIRATDYEKNYYLGKQGTSITVEPNGTLDLYGWYDWQGHTLVLNGGTLANTRANMTQSSWNAVGPVVQTADSKMNVTYDILFNSGSSVVDLGGYTLTAVNPGTTQRSIYLNSTTFKNGTLLVEKNVRFKAMKATNAGAGFALVVNGDISMYTSNLTIESLTDNSQGNGEGSKVITVTQYFKPLSDYLANMTINDGVTVDLSSRTGAWSTLSAYADHVVGFASGATVTVDLGGRTLVQGDKIITWETKPTDATFQWDDETAKSGVKPVLEDDGLYYGVDGSDIDTAEWTGGAGASNYDATNPKNWRCTDFSGKVVSGAIPGDKATLIVNMALSKDADWSVLGPVVFSDDSRINLQGQSFTIAGFRTKEGVEAGAIVDNDATETGDFVVNIGEGKTAENTMVAITGNTRLVKKGAGTFVNNKQQDYTGGTLVSAGVVKLPAVTSGRYYLGADGNSVTVENDATFNMNGCYDLNVYTIILAGGTLRTERVSQASPYNKGSLGTVMLTADSYFDLAAHVLFYRSAGAKIDMGGHRLDVTGSGYLLSLNQPAVITNGVFSIGSGVRFNPRQANINMTGASVVMRGVWENHNIVYTVRDLDITTVANVSRIDVRDTFRSANSTFGPVRLLKDATLDLAENTGTLATAGKLTFVDEAAITVNLAGRTNLSPGLQIVSWPDTAAPADSVSFTLKGVFYYLVRKADGLYIDRGVMTIFR